MLTTTPPDIPTEKKLNMGEEELDVLKGIWLRWIKSDFDWAVEEVLQNGRTGEEDEWEFMRLDWLGKFDDWLYPYVYRLYKTDHITKEQKEEFVGWAMSEMKLKLSALETLEVTNE